jgi:hypothetical protein
VRDIDEEWGKALPDVLPTARGSQAMDWETLDCPHHHCRCYGKPFSQGSLVKTGSIRGQPQAWYKVCKASVRSALLRQTAATLYGRSAGTVD